MAKQPLKPNRALLGDVRIAHLENQFAALQQEVARLTKEAATKVVQDVMNTSTSSSTSSGSGVIPESDVIFDDSGGHSHDGIDGGTPIDLAGDVTGTNLATVVEAAQGIEFPIPAAADNLKVLAYLHASTEYVLRALPFIVRSISADETLDADDFMLIVDATGAARTITLPAASSSVGAAYAVIKADASVNAVTLDADGADTIAGAGTAALLTQYEALLIVSDGTSAWWAF